MRGLLCNTFLYGEKESKNIKYTMTTRVSVSSISSRIKKKDKNLRVFPEYREIRNDTHSKRNWKLLF